MTCNAITRLTEEWETCAVDTKEREEFITALASFLGDLMFAYPEHIQPFAVEQTTRAASIAAEAGIWVAEPAEMFATFRNMSPETAAAFLLPAFDWGDIDTGKPNKYLAVEVAGTFGPDWAQLLYRFAVLVTKLA